MKLHHTVNHIPVGKIAESIEINGIVPQIADEYKDLVPPEIRHLPVVWLAEGIWQGRDLPVFEVDRESLDAAKLYHVNIVDEGDKNLGWWVYQGSIPANILTRLRIHPAKTS